MIFIYSDFLNPKERGMCVISRRKYNHFSTNRQKYRIKKS